MRKKQCKWRRHLLRRWCQQFAKRHDKPRERQYPEHVEHVEHVEHGEQARLRREVT